MPLFVYLLFDEAERTSFESRCDRALAAISLWNMQTCSVYMQYMQCTCMQCSTCSVYMQYMQCIHAVHAVYTCSTCSVHAVHAVHAVIYMQYMQSVHAVHAVHAVYTCSTCSTCSVHAPLQYMQCIHAVHTVYTLHVHAVHTFCIGNRVFWNFWGWSFVLSHLKTTRICQDRYIDKTDVTKPAIALHFIHHLTHFCFDACTMPFWLR